MARDYYELLGVSRNSSKEDIKRGFRRLARKYHPDVNKEPDAEDKFKEINRAYEVLSDPQLKARYDQFGEAGVSAGAAGGPGGFQDMGDMGGFADIFESFFTNFGGATTSGRRRSGPVRGDDLRFDLKLDFLEAVFGGEKQIRISHLEVCEVCNGSGAQEGTGPTTCPTCGGAGQVRRATRTPFGSFTQLTVCPTCSGSGEVIEDFCDNCGGQGLVQSNKKLRITIPPGVDSGTRLRVSGEGDAGRRKGPTGDLYVYLFIEPDETFQRDGINILSEVHVSYLQAILGATLAIPTVDGDEELTIPAGAQPGDVLRLEDKGVPKLGNSVARGDHLITLVVEIPKKVDAEEREILEQLAELRGEETNKGGGRFLGGLFR
ncbi:MAG: molecular chaperone DnaJ [Synechococcus sp.]